VIGSNDSGRKYRKESVKQKEKRLVTSRRTVGPHKKRKEKAANKSHEKGEKKENPRVLKVHVFQGLTRRTFRTEGMSWRPLKNL